MASCSGDLQGTWKIINSILGNNKKNDSEISVINVNDCNLTKDESIANAFNDHFINVGRKLAEKIKDNSVSPEFFLNNPVRDSIVVSPITENDLVTVVAGLNDSAAGYDNIPTKILKYVIDTIKIPFTHIVNSSLISGTFPDIYKQSKVIPLFKGGCKTSLNNFRPISLLPSFSKILEKIMHIQMENFFDSNNVITPLQFGFRKTKSTTSAILTITDHILKSFDSSKYTIGLFLDFKKAFDSVNHRILMRKLYHYGIRGVAYNWVLSFLSNRKQHVYLNKVTSENSQVTHSVPQGSILAPLLFNIYINDIVNCTKYLKSVLYADDSCFYTSNNNIIDLINDANSDLITVNRWLNANKLTLNIDKSHFIIFSRNKPLPQNLPNVKINNMNVKQLNQTKFLGIELQNNLKWNTQVNSIINKINKLSAILFLTRDRLDKPSLKIIYNSLVYSNISYANLIWGETTKRNKNRLLVAQKKIIRTIQFKARYDSTDEDFKLLGFLKIPDINVYFSQIFVYKSLNNLTFPANYFSYSHSFHERALRHSNQLRAPFSRSSQGRTSPAIYCCDIWNDLPDSIKSKPSVGSFKSALKKYLIDRYDM